MSRRNKGVDDVISSVQSLTDYEAEITKGIIYNACGYLDELVNEIKSYSLADTPDTELENLIVKLSSALYYAGAEQEKIGISVDACRVLKHQIYTNTREGIKGTVADKDAKALLEVEPQILTLSIYTQAYKTVKFKVEAGFEMLNSLKKILTRRIAELELSQSRYIGGQNDTAR